MKNKIQIGVIGSSGNKISARNRKFAKEIGKEIAKTDCILLYGQEEKVNSVSQIAAKSLIKNGGQAVAFLHDKNRKCNISEAIRITTGQNLGGGREFSFILSCDAIISIGGGSGTLMETSIAYQANIPVITLPESGGWSKKLAGKFLDDRERLKLVKAENVKSAVATAIKLAKKYNDID